MLISLREIDNLKEQPHVIKCRNYAKYDPTIFCIDLKKVPWDTVLSSTNVDEAWSLWKYNFTAECDKHAPLIEKKVRGRNNNNNNNNNNNDNNNNLTFILRAFHEMIKHALHDFYL